MSSEPEFFEPVSGEPSAGTKVLVRTDLQWRSSGSMDAAASDVTILP